MNELLNWATVLAYFAVFLMGLGSCFREAKLAWTTRNNTGLTILRNAHIDLKLEHQSHWLFSNYWTVSSIPRCGVK